jgi:peptidoglycan hydrolase-like protein with peptidoglycan-binding domain
MKKIIKLTENQLKDIVSKVIKEQGVPMYNPDTLTTPANSSSQERIANIAKTLTANNGVLPRDYIVKYDINPIELQAAKSLIGQQKTTQDTQNQRNKNIVNAINSIDPQSLLIKSSNPKLNGMTWKQYRDTYKITDADITNAKSYLSKTNPNDATKLDKVEKSSKSNSNCAPQLIDTSKGKILKFGCKTQGVKELQNLLDVTPITGYFGDKTLAAVKALQASKNIKVDGIVGIETYPYVLSNGKTNTPPPVQDVTEDDDIAMLDNLFKKD